VLDLARPRGHDQDTIAHVDCFIDVMRDEQHGGTARFPKAKHLVLQAHPGKGIQSAQGLVKQENHGMVD
jgi:hypothetical protein